MLNGSHFRSLTAGGKYHVLPVFDGSLSRYFKCGRCRRDLPDSHFYPIQNLTHISNRVACDPRIRNGSVLLLRGVCKGCLAQAKGKWSSHPLYSPGLDRYWSSMAAKMRGGARSRGIFAGIDKEDLLGLYIGQEGLCALTGLKMDWQATGTRGRGNRALNAPSIDRIDSKKDYVPGNVQLVLEAVNRMKSDLPQEMFIELCGKISNRKTAS